MTIVTKNEIIDKNIKIPKGTEGVVKGIDWGEDKRFWYIVTFPQCNLIKIAKFDVIIKDQQNGGNDEQQKKSDTTEKQADKPERKEKLSASIDKRKQNK